MATFIAFGGLSHDKQQFSNKRNRSTKYTISSGLPIVQYHKSVTGEEFEDMLKRSCDEEYSNAKPEYDKDIMETLAGTYSWQSFWKLMLYVFGCSPWDLETWGLRLSLTEKEKTVKLLGRLLPHPVWECRVDILRFVLQKTITYRYGSDMEPLGPLAPGIAKGVVKAKPPNAADTALAMWEESNPRTNHNIDQLLKEISKKVAASKSKPKSANLLILEPEDVIIVSEALDTIQVYTVDQYWDSFVRYQPNWPGGMTPYDAETIIRWDGLNLSEKENRWVLGAPDIPPREREHNEELRYWRSQGCDSQAARLVTWGDI
ncbi:hypothetical protein F4820DRAFT_192709 [Hypoxylon rubiginosum]|uniref:Uncharacterized protein n=1 Tax=Hypoxylon rubiginosum TaxID=110542 RepID=A0ACB9Z928_9PEZI|nr:hypothetical protein F4820DRAFT_192709 [Hypoxylon rubiginosum]